MSPTIFILIIAAAVTIESIVMPLYKRHKNRIVAKARLQVVSDTFEDNRSGAKRQISTAIKEIG